MSERPHRVAYFAHTGEIGGPNNSLIALLQGLDRDRFEPFVYFPSEGGCLEQLTRSDESCRVVPTHLIEPSRGLGGTFIYLRELCGSSAALRRALRRDRIDLVHINTSVTPHPGFAARSLSIPIVWHVREILRRTRRHDWYITMMMRLATRVVPVSEAARRRLVGPVPGRSDRVEKTRVIANGIDLERFDGAVRQGISPDDLRLPAGRKIIATPGSLLPRHKGHEVLLEAASELLNQRGVRNFCIVFIGEEEIENGDRPLTRSLKEYCDRQRLNDHVVFAGFRRDVPALLGRADIVCLPSLCEDAFPRGVLEGMAAGKPVIGSDIGGIPEMLAHHETGVLVPPGNVRVLADALAGLIADDARSVRLGRAARARVEDRFTSQAHARRVEGLYRDVLATC